MKLIVRRTVTVKECPWLDQDIPAGTSVYLWTGHDYGCITPNGTAVTLVPDENPFFELPTSAIKPVVE